MSLRRMVAGCGLQRQQPLKVRVEHILPRCLCLLSWGKLQREVSFTPRVGVCGLKGAFIGQKMRIRWKRKTLDQKWETPLGWSLRTQELTTFLPLPLSCTWAASAMLSWTLSPLSTEETSRLAPQTNGTWLPTEVPPDEIRAADALRLRLRHTRLQSVHDLASQNQFPIQVHARCVDIASACFDVCV